MPANAIAGAERPRLIADVGGTHTRCALLEHGRMGPAQVMRNDEHADLAAALRAALAALAPPAPVMEGAVAVAAPVRGDDVHMTNRGWRFSIEGLRKELALTRLEVVNDFTAIALSLPMLGAADRVAIGSGAPLPGAALAALGTGTGLGVSALIPNRDGAGWAAVNGEGGHSTLAASNELEARLIERTRARYGHVSAERFLSGPGLLTLHESLAAELGSSSVARTPEEVTSHAGRGDALARQTLDLFFSFLGTVAGDVALIYGALGGVYLAGGILPQLREALAASPFRARFEDKGRYRDYMRAIPTYLTVAPQPGLLGLQSLFV